MRRHQIISLLLAVMLFSCNKDDSRKNHLGSILDISDAKELYVETIDIETYDSGRGIASLYKIRHDGSIAKVPIVSSSGKEIAMEHIGIAPYNSESIILTYYSSNATKYLAYVVNKRSGVVTEIREDMYQLSSVVTSVASGHNIDHYNDSYGNLYNHESGDRYHICKYTKDIKKEILTNDSDIDTRGEFAVDMNGNLIVQIYKQHWLYRASDGRKIEFQMPIKYTQYSSTVTVFGLKDRLGFYYFNTVEGENKGALHLLQYDESSKQMKTSIISDKLDNYASDFFAIHYQKDKIILLGNKHTTIIDQNGEITFSKLKDANTYNSYYTATRNSVTWFSNGYKRAARFNIATQSFDQLYDLSGYDISQVTNELDGTITIYGRNEQTGKNVMANIRNGVVVSETPWSDSKVREVSHFILM